MELLRTHRLGIFVGEMVAYVRENYSDWASRMNDLELAAFVNESIRNAQRFGVQFSDNLQAFLDFSISVGQDFLGEPSLSWAKKVLESDDFDETEKVNRLNEYLVFTTNPTLQSENLELTIHTREQCG